MTATVVSLAAPSEEFVPACTTDPERWTTHPDEEAKALCRACPLRCRCAREAWETPGAEGLWAGVVIPESGRGRGFALGQLRELAAHGGYPVRPGLRAQRRIVLPGA
jgi:WhiB family transcriptional regulator, redox-sensing transcriptional regulator